MKFCTQCGKQLADEALFCMACGTKNVTIMKPTQEAIELVEDTEQQPSVKYGLEQQENIQTEFHQTERQGDCSSEDNPAYVSPKSATVILRRIMSPVWLLGLFAGGGVWLRDYLFKVALDFCGKMFLKGEVTAETHSLLIQLFSILTFALFTLICALGINCYNGICRMRGKQGMRLPGIYVAFPVFLKDVASTITSLICLIFISVGRDTVAISDELTVCHILFVGLATPLIMLRLLDQDGRTYMKGGSKSTGSMSILQKNNVEESLPKEKGEGGIVEPKVAPSAWKVQFSVNKKLFTAVVAIVLIVAVLIMIVSAMSSASIVGVWMSGTSKIEFTEDGDFSNSYASYGTYNITSDKTLEMQYGEYSYFNGRETYKWGPEAKDNSSYWYISGNTLYISGVEYTRK